MAKKVFLLTENFIDQYKEREPNWGYGELGKFVYRRTYSKLQDDGTYEDWWQTVKRVVEGVYNLQLFHCDNHGLPFNMNKAQISAQTMYDLVFTMKFLPPGRGLEHMGSLALEKKGSAILYNCSAISTADLKHDPARPFTFMMDFSALGVGVGFDVKGEGTLVKGCDDSNSYIHEVDDSREGWVESLRLLIESHFRNKPLPIFEYSKIRPAGSRLVTMNGTASGPGPLREMHEAIHGILSAHRGKGISITGIVDIMNWIGRCIVSGGTRRSSQLCLGPLDSAEYLDLKNPAKYEEELKSHRWAANHSIYASIGMDYTDSAYKTGICGEPGYAWMENITNRGRLKDGYVYDSGTLLNPCAEIVLESGELCNLVTVYPNNHTTLDDINHTLKYAYLYSKSVTLLPTHDKTVNAIIGANRRIGASFSGVVQSVAKFGYRNLMNQLDKSYIYVRHLDEIYSKWLCVPRSNKISSSKPDGTTGIIAGATPGVRYQHSQFYIRRIRVQDGSPLIDACRRAGYKVEKTVYKDNTYCIEFPIKESQFLKAQADVSIWEQTNLVADMQHYWSDNSISATIGFKKSERDDIKSVLENYEDKLKSISFLPSDEDTYEQSPYETITEQQFNKMASKIKKIDFSSSEKEASDKFCDGAACAI